MASKKTEAAPAAIDKTRVVHDGQEYTEVKEGLGRILIPASANATTTAKDVQAEEDRQRVFYNPIQQFNRDLTVLAIKAYGEEIAAKRRKVAETKLNKRKRKRADNEEARPQKQDKLAQETPMDDGSAAAGAAEAPVTAAQGDPMDTSEPQNDTAVATDEARVEENGTTKEVGTGIPDETAGTTNEESKAGRETRQRIPDAPRFTILDALSATGLRALRYVQELPFVTSVTANDLTASAVEAIRRNAEHNGIADKVNATQSDARAHMYSLVAQEVTQEHARNPHPARRGAPAPSKKYDVIDLDPYGTAATFFDAAVHAVRDDGGLLCVTCTDSGVWASHGYSEKAFALYGGIPVKGFHSHEAGLRLILNGLAQTAAKQGLAIEPLLSLSIDYYLRIFVRIKKSPASVKFLAGKTMIVYSCDQGCGSWETQMLLRNKKVSNNKGNSFFYKHGLSMGPTADSHCAHCGSKTHLSGPMYGGPLHNREFVQRILDDLPNVDKSVYGTTARIEGMLQTALEEFLAPPADPHAPIKDDELAAIEPYPFYFHPTTLAGTVHSVCPDEESFRGALRGLGYEVTRSHCKPGSIKTNAPWAVIWHIMREWVRQKAPVKVENIKEGSAAYKILRLGKDDSETKDEASVAIDKLEVVFDKAAGHDKTKKNLVRYQVNPKENWGPLSRARG